MNMEFCHVFYVQRAESSYLLGCCGSLFLLVVCWKLSSVLFLDCPKSPSVIRLAAAVRSYTSGNLLAYHIVASQFSRPRGGVNAKTA